MRVNSPAGFGKGRQKLQVEAPIVAVGALNKKDTPDWNCSTTRGGLNEVLHMGSAVVMKCGVRSEVCVYADKLN